MLKKLWTPCNQPHTNSGFSLVELLVGVGLGALVVAGGGAAIATMLDSSTTANARSERRVEISRALEFMTVEVNRASELIQSPAIPSDLLDAVSASSLGIDASEITPVLQLNLPGSGDESTGQLSALSSQPVTYFTANSTNGSWRGPKVLYRWGPAFDSSGVYVNPAATSEWQILTLADRLEDFDATVSGSSVRLTPVGQIQRLLGRTESYPVSKNANLKGGFVAKSNFSPGRGSFGTSTSLFTVSRGNLQIDTDSRIDITFLGGQVTCGADGPAVPTLSRATLLDENGVPIEDSGFIDPANGISYDVMANTTLRLDGWLQGDSSSGDCSDLSIQYNTEDNQGTQVLTVVDGDIVPEFSPFGSQPDIEFFLESYIDEDTGRVRLRPNEVIFLYELGTADSTEAAYDLQDLVVLATISPTQSSTTTESFETETDLSFDVSNGNDDDSVETNGRQVVRDALGNIICRPTVESSCN